MQRSTAFTLAITALLGFPPLLAVGQMERLPNATDPPPGIKPLWASLPTDRDLRVEAGLPPEPGLLDGQVSPIPPSVDLKTLLKPRVDLSSEWEPEQDGFSIGSYDASIRMPVYPIFGPPPPMLSSGYTFTQINALDTFDLPSSLHEFTLGAGWMRRINDKWMARLMASAAFASDLENTGSDAWQLRGGGFAIYRPNDRWSLAFGALATGRDDLPVLPAIGAIWEPNPAWQVNLMMPNPRVSRLLWETGARQYWGYLGGGISGGTWAFDRSTGEGTRLSYREWRLVLGWESKRRQAPGSFRPVGTRFHAEVGYVFGRRFEFEHTAAEIPFDDAILLRSGISF